MAMVEHMFGILLAAKADLLGDAGLAAEGRAEVLPSWSWVILWRALIPCQVGLRAPPLYK